MRKAARALAAVAAIWAVNPMQAVAQQWPDKPVRILVPFPPGGGTDIQAWLMSVAFQKSMGQNFIIDNRTGASGLIATQLAVDSPPDGNTILFTSGSISVIVTLYAKRMKFDAQTDLMPVSWISSTPLVLSLHPSVPAKSVRELVALAKARLDRVQAMHNPDGVARARDVHVGVGEARVLADEGSQLIPVEGQHPMGQTGRLAELDIKHPAGGDLQSKRFLQHDEFVKQARSSIQSNAGPGLL